MQQHRRPPALRSSSSRPRLLQSSNIELTNVQPASISLRKPRHKPPSLILKSLYLSSSFLTVGASPRC